VQTVDAKLRSRIYGRGRGATFTPIDFLDLGGRDAVDKVLSRLASKGPIRRLARGHYTALYNCLVAGVRKDDIL